MNRLKELARRLKYLWRRGSFDHELDDEVQFHIESRADELEHNGVPRSEALSQARREFGSPVRMRERTRAAWQVQWLEDLLSDLRYALRALRRNPGFTAAAIFSLALGIGANTTIFSLTMEFLFSQPSCRNPENKYRFLRDAHLFEGLAGSFLEAESNWRYGEDTYNLHVMRVTGNFFEVVGVPLAFGRPIQPTEQSTVVLSYRFWQQRLSGDPNILRRVLVLDGQPYTVAGILPRNHRTLIGFGWSPDLYMPVTRQDEIVALVARLPHGMTRKIAFDRLKAACKELDKVYPRSNNSSWTNQIIVAPVAGLDRLHELGLAFIGYFFAMLMIVVGLVLLIACANVSSLLLARASSRRNELAIRLAIGAARGRIVRQLLAESLLLALLGTVTGLLLNIWLTGVMSRVQIPAPAPIQLLIEPDWRLLLYSSGLAIATALVAGLMPALKATRGGLSAALKLDQRQVGNQRWTLRNALVVGQLAISVVLLATGFLFLRNMTKATTLSPGFDADHSLWAYTRLVPEKYSTPEKTRAFITSALDQLRSLPGVEAASIARAVPLNDHVTMGTEFRNDLNDRPVPVDFNFNWVAPDYFKTMGIRVLGGREFLSSDRNGAPRVAIINENLGRRLFGNTNPVGHVIRWDGPVTIVGVAGNSKYFTIGEERPLALYVPYFQEGSIVNLHFLIRAAYPPGVLKDVNRALGRLDSSAAIEVKLMRDALGFAFLPSRVGAALLGTMGMLGLALASIGLYGVLAYAVSRRIREIGLRMALGADSRAIVRMVIAQSLSLVATGVGIGLGLAVFAIKPLAMFLVPELSTTDPATFLAVVAVLVAVALTATLGPALRAVSVDPVIALRYE
jgi:predicted permease